ncbi:hypothetical protein [Actibacterium pelagium]|uniref:Lipoprotein n=1 Tax=Actibacterium pelagium TaxID=2029103 RepID=A0A917AFZ5_9RHOB|nr:hypothetical protein [Actibacterium pelagium]GGE49601.1 hypothetical protein GCM10011517_16760 [Actibacterium pelagium]
MKKVLIPIALTILTACDAPSPGMSGAITREVTVEGSTFTVHRLGDRAEAIRTNFEFRDGVMARGHRAIELATGCQIVRGSFTGDPALMKAKLKC